MASVPRTCEVIEDGTRCDRPRKAYGMCQMHALRHKKYGDPTITKLPRSKTDTYGRIHRRLKDKRGPASKHACIDCGKQAQHWSYQHGCPEEQYEPRRGAFCTHLNEHYHPRCVPCHNKYDPPKEREKIICTVEGCSIEQNAKGLCHTHYYRWRKSGSTDAPQRPARQKCQVIERGETCGRPQNARGMCATHYDRWWRTGTAERP
jgi:hypothetical protein